MADNVVYLICNLFRVYLMGQFIRLFFKDVKVDKRLETGAYFLFFVVNSGLYLGLHMAWLNLACNLAGAVLLILLYTSNWKYLVFVTVLLNVLSAGSDVLATSFVLSTYQDGDTIGALTFIVVDMILFICVQLVEKFISVNNKDEAMPSIILVFVPIVSIGLIYMLVYMEQHSPIEIILVGTGILLINFLVLYLYNMLVDSLTQIYENKMFTQGVLTYKNQLGVILETEKRVHQLRHDMKHHLLELRLLADRHQETEIVDYICKMESYMTNPDEFAYTRNAEIDSLLNYMLVQAKEKGLEISTKVQIPRSIEHSFDVNVVIGNLLDNAISAAAESEEKKLSVTITMKQGILKIIIENSYHGKGNRVAPELMTMKPDKDRHGIGLQNVRQIVKQYRGTIEISAKDTFRVMVVLYM